MCGIVVLAKADTSNCRSIEDAVKTLRHRGPDAAGCETVSQAGHQFHFGHARLAIRELSTAGAQPMWSGNRRWLLAFNGELYNSERLRQQLPTTRFRGESDTETLVECLASHGINKTLELVNGMFAFVALDLDSDAIHAARDGTGIKPLYVHQFIDGIAFSSEVRGLRALGINCGELNQEALPVYLTLRYVPSPLTLYKGITRISPGTLVTWSPHAGLKERHFQYIAQSISDNVDDVTTRFGALLNDAVRRQLVSDVPVGVLLSGGLDSAVLAATLKKLDASPTCFTVGFSEGHEDVSEISAAAQTAQQLGLPHFALGLTVSDLITVIPNVFDHLEEPLGTVSTLAMWHLSRFARTKVTVVLAGQGADEPMGGYRRHRIEAFRARLPFAASTALRTAARFLQTRIPTDQVQLMKLLATFDRSEMLSTYIAQRTVFTNSELRELGDFDASSCYGLLQRSLSIGTQTICDDVQKALWLDTRTQLADDLLLYGDKISMGHSLEVRVPFLDAEFLAYVESLPSKLKVTPWQSKKILRTFAAQLLPESILRRPKRGFHIPNLFRIPAFAKEALDVVVHRLGPNGLGLSSAPLIAHMTKGQRGGLDEVRAWTLYSLAEWTRICLQANSPD